MKNFLYLLFGLQAQRIWSFSVAILFYEKHVGGVLPLIYHR